MSISGLKNAAENYKAYALAKDMIVWTVQKSALQGATEEAVGQAYPVLLSRGFIVNHVPGLKLVIAGKKQEVDENRVPSLVERKSFGPPAGN